MARYKLRAQHVIAGGVREAGEEVGDGTGVPFDLEPSNQMEGVDAEGRDKVNAVHQRMYGHDAPWHTKEADAQREADKKAAEDDAKAEAAAAAKTVAAPVTPVPTAIPSRGPSPPPPPMPKG